MPVQQVLTNIDDINAVAVAAYTALQQQAAASGQTAAGAVRHLQQSGSGFVPLSSLQAIFDAVSKVNMNCHNADVYILCGLDMALVAPCTARA
jgi:hypothetical protein